jgi:sugar phosphate isomerase/epimerase
MTQSLERVRKIGYRAVQISGTGPIEDAELARILDGEGLVCCATHEPAHRLLAEPQAVVERLGKLGARHTAYPYPSGETLATLEDVKSLAARLNAAGRVLHEGGKVLSYHNHHVEFRRVDGKTILDHLYEESDARYLRGEIDTYWVQYGGGDPVRWCERLAGRLPLLHMKDFAIGKDNQPVFAEVGSGNLDWARIVPAAEAAGCEWYIVEQDICPGDPFDSIAKSLRFIEEHILCI